ncbi:MAG: DUF805 domain-containing protein [Pseudomonadota bacterium]
MVTFQEAVQLFFKRYTDFKGRSRRSEYWWVQLFNFIVVLIPVILMLAIGGITEGEPNPIGIALIAVIGLYVLAIIIPGIALGVRRFHDLDQTGWLVLVFAVVGQIPLVGLLASIGQIVWFCFPGTVGPNKYGPDPKQGNIVPDTFS